MNNDFRVANIQDKSLRVNLETQGETTDVTLLNISKETRILRFYQTQSAWMQNASESLKREIPSFSDREGKFEQSFNKRFTGLNYYPASASWADFWKEYPVSEIAFKAQEIS